MSKKNPIALRLWNGIARSQRKLQKLMIKKADNLKISLLTVDMMVVVRENEKVAIANILPANGPIGGQLQDVALVYLDLPRADLVPGFYRIQLLQDSAATTQAILADARGRFVSTLRYFALDVFAPITGPKTVPAKKLLVFETFNKSNGSYAIGGTHADGQAFVIVL